jgi:hypothetical protein
MLQKFFTNWSFCAFALSMALGAARTATDMLARRRQPQWANSMAAASSAAPGQTNGFAAATAPVPGASLGPAASPACTTEMDIKMLAASGHEEAAAAAAGGGKLCDVTGTSHSGSWTPLAKAHLAVVAVAYPAELFLALFYWIFLFGGADSHMPSWP